MFNPLQESVNHNALVKTLKRALYSLIVVTVCLQVILAYKIVTDHCTF